MHAGQIVLAPIVSEKSYHGSVNGIYTFRVHNDAHKTQIRQAVEEALRGQRPARERDQGAAQAQASRPDPRSKPGWKKAIVQLKAGQTIEVFQGAQL